jgi:hypothetical protein
LDAVATGADDMSEKKCCCEYAEELRTALDELLLWTSDYDHSEAVINARAVLAKNPTNDVAQDASRTSWESSQREDAGSIPAVVRPDCHSVFRAEAREVWTTITGNGPGLWKDYDLQSVETLEKALQRAATLSQSVESGWTRYGEKMPTGADTEAGIDIRYVSTEPKGFLSAVAWRRTPCALNVQSKASES